ncbi:MAG: ABC transporter ATP-binding protein [Ichthyobacteriaceae bacterium]|nr:ABC transporter ATP-binding protein [Ichthyobacteriaceae bacterium]
MIYVKKLFRYISPYTRYGVLNIIFNLLYVLFSLFSISVLMPVMGILFKTQESVFVKPIYHGIGSASEYATKSLNYYITMQMEQHGPMQALAIISVAGAVMFLFKNLFRFLAVYELSFLRTGIIKDLRDELHHKVINLHTGFFSNQRKGDIMARITTDINEIQGTFLNSIEQLIREPFMIVSTLTLMIYLSPELTVFVFVLLPVSGFLISSIGSSLKKKSAVAQKLNGYILSLVEEHINGIRVIKAFTVEKNIEEKFENTTTEYRTAMISVLNRNAMASPISEFLGSLVIFTIVGYGGYLVLGGESDLKPQEFFVYIGLFYQILNPAKALTSAYYNMLKGSASAERIFEILETKNEITDKDNAKEIKLFEEDIKLNNITFKYEENENYVVKDVSFKVSKGKSVALVGQSGSGKTTIANLIPRFYDTTGGEILIDGVNIKDVSKKSLRSLIGIVTQESILFNDSISSNLTLGVDNVSEEEIIKAAKIANAHEFITNLPNGYDTNIGDGGNKLSGGQKQRLSIARAILNNPPILILDEATSALDTESEKLVQQALGNLMENRTSIIIAHRLSTIKNADSIIVMKQGEILEQGNHENLLNKKGEYYKLIQMQSFE